MNFKIYLKCESQEAALRLGNKIMNDVAKGKCPTWNQKDIPGPNQTEKPVIYHKTSSGQFSEKGKDVCFGFYIEENFLVIESGLLSNWCANPDVEQQQLHFGRLTSLLLTYRPYFNELIIL